MGENFDNPAATAPGESGQGGAVGWKALGSSVGQFDSPGAPFGRLAISDGASTADGTSSSPVPQPSIPSNHAATATATAAVATRSAPRSTSQQSRTGLLHLATAIQVETQLENLAAAIRRTNASRYQVMRQRDMLREPCLLDLPPAPGGVQLQQMETQLENLAAAIRRTNASRCQVRAPRLRPLLAVMADPSPPGGGKRKSRGKDGEQGGGGGRQSKSAKKGGAAESKSAVAPAPSRRSARLSNAPRKDCAATDEGNDESNEDAANPPSTSLVLTPRGGPALNEFFREFLMALSADTATTGGSPAAGASRRLRFDPVANEGGANDVGGRGEDEEGGDAMELEARNGSLPPPA